MLLGAVSSHGYSSEAIKVAKHHNAVTQWLYTILHLTFAYGLRLSVLVVNGWIVVSDMIVVPEML